MKHIFIIGLIVAAMTVQSLADGKMFWREEIPPKIPYQRALILFQNGSETLVLQSRYEIPETGKKTTLGWVVPVPAVPEVASMPADEARRLFGYLSRTSSPRITRISTIGVILLLLLLITVAGLSALTLLRCLLSFVVPFSPSFIQRRRKFAQASVLGLLCCVLMFLIIFNAGTKSEGVAVVSEHRVGIYDVRVVRSDDAGKLISWLKTNQFNFGEQDTAAFNSYILGGWCFVVAIINRTGDEHESEIASEGLAAPLILRFPHANPVYPLVLTGTGEYETEIVIYLASETKMSCDDRLRLRFADDTQTGALGLNLIATEPKGFFNLPHDGYLHLCKFKGRLGPTKMSEDIIFSRGKDKKPYREHTVKW